MITISTMEILQNLVANLLPIPAKQHYVFSLHDVSKVYQGLMRANKDYIDSQESYIKMWIHELYRSMQDRMIDSADKTWFNDMYVSEFVFTV